MSISDRNVLALSISSSLVCPHQALMCVCAHAHICMYVFCACVCASIQSEPPSGVLSALLQPCFSLGICHGARINKHRWKKKKKKKLSSFCSPLFVNGQIISKFQSVYHHRRGKTLLNFTVLSVICTTFISFMTRL